MKRILVVAALVFQGLITEATTVTVRPSVSMPLARTLNAGAFVPMIAVDVKASGKQFPPDTYLIIREIGLAGWETNSGIASVYVGGPEKLYSWGPFQVSSSALTIVGPIFLEQDVWRTVTISAQLSTDLSSLSGRTIGLEVDAITVDGGRVELGDQVVYEGAFPIRGQYFPITNSPAETLTIRNTTGDLAVIAGSEQTLASFDFIAENGDVKITDLPFDFVFGQGDISALQNVVLVNEKDELLAKDGSIYTGEAITGEAIYFRNVDLVVPQGTNHWLLKGVISTNLPLSTTLKVGVEVFGEAYGLSTTNWILPTLDNGGGNASVYSVMEFNGSFTRYLTIGSVGADVRVLQRVLNLSADTQVATEGDGSPGNETIYFDEATKAAVIKFQTNYGLPATGFVGPLTLARLNSLNLVNQLTARIDQVVVDNLGGLAIMGSMKPNTSYSIQASEDLATWNVVGTVQGNALGVLKEPIGNPTEVDPKYKNKAFFRLVEQP